MKKIYNHKKFESIVQKYWKKNKTFKASEDLNKKKYYCLAMLPYPSGKLHMGHVRNYTISDVIARYQRMIGKNVLHPIGWDAFGLPAELAAIENNIIPSEWTYKNIKYMKKQLQSLGYSYDWDREITTCHPEYYRWEQWFFKKLYEKKLIYKKTSLINWCPKDQTVLSNEQVIHGTCWRCQTSIEIKLMPQWFIKITKYADRLLQDLKILKKWPTQVINMQKKWIGKLKGFEISFKIMPYAKKIKIYTSRLDLLMYTTYISISPLHELAQNILNEEEIQLFINNLYTINSNINKKKINYIGKKINQYAIHPITQKRIPIWITNYTEIEYNTKIKLCHPINNKIDWNFAKKYHIKITLNHPINHVSTQQDILVEKTIQRKNNVYNFSKKINQIESNNIFNILQEKKIVKAKNKYRLQDWSISRQRYWGTPIPIAYQNGKTICISEKEMPVLLPKINTIYDFQNIKEIYKTWSKININHLPAKRETDTFDTFIESSWYYIRYTAPHYNEGMINKKLANYWLPIDQYIGGIEHATMHLIYFRFFHKLLYDLKLVSSIEPAKQLLCQGMVLSDAFYYIDNSGKKNWVNLKEIQIKKKKIGNTKNIFTNQKEEIIHAGMIKMSKSKKNGVDPEIMIKKYGADTVRLFIMFAAPVTSNIEWKETGVHGMYRFLQKVWNLIYCYKKYKKLSECGKEKHTHDEINFFLHQTIFQVTQDIHKRKSFNTAIAKIITFINFLYATNIDIKKNKKFIKHILNTIIIMLYPFTPHFSFIAWEKLNKNNLIDYEKWPKYNINIIKKKNINLIIQINGKKKDIINIPKKNKQNEILEILKKKSKISHIFKKKIKKIIYITDKLINFVI